MKKTERKLKQNTNHKARQLSSKRSESMTIFHPQTCVDVPLAENKKLLERQVTGKTSLLLHIALLLPTDSLEHQLCEAKIHLLPQPPEASYTSNSCSWSSLPAMKRKDCITLQCGLRCQLLSPNSQQCGLQLGVATLTGSPLCTEEGGHRWPVSAAGPGPGPCYPSSLALKLSCAACAL